MGPKKKKKKRREKSLNNVVARFGDCAAIDVIF